MLKLNSFARGNWAFVCFILIVSFIIALFGSPGRELFSYQSGVFRNAEIWRVVSGHVTHLGWPHLLLNAFGLLGVWSLYGKTFNTLSWSIVFLMCALGISACFNVFDKEIQSYVGLSGVLHGFLAAGAVHSLFLANHAGKSFLIEDVFVLSALGLKIAYEQLIGSVPLTGALSGGAVVVNAHFYGAIVGVIVGCVICLLARIRSGRVRFDPLN